MTWITTQWDLADGDAWVERFVNKPKGEPQYCANAFDKGKRLWTKRFHTFTEAKEWCEEQARGDV